MACREGWKKGHRKVPLFFAMTYGRHPLAVAHLRCLKSLRPSRLALRRDLNEGDSHGYMHFACICAKRYHAGELLR